MGNFKLNKTVKGKKFEYTVTDKDGNVLSKRMSCREYVACTVNGQFYFGRVDLIGKGEHGRLLNWTNEVLANPELAYKKQAAYLIPSARREWIAENPIDEWIASYTASAKIRKIELDSIAYLINE